MSIKDGWKEAGKDIGKSFAGLGKAIIKSAKVGVDKALDEETEEQKEQGTGLGKSWGDVGKSFGEAGKSFGKAVAGTASGVLDKIDGEPDEVVKEAELVVEETEEEK